MSVQSLPATGRAATGNVDALLTNSTIDITKYYILLSPLCLLFLKASLIFLATHNLIVILLDIQDFPGCYCY